MATITFNTTPGATVLFGSPINQSVVADANGVASIEVDDILKSIVPVTITTPTSGMGTSIALDVEATESVNVSDMGLEPVVRKSSVAQAKKIAIRKIDLRTAELIAQGFVHNAVQFSASSNAQKNWLGAYTARDRLTYPLKVSTKDDTEYMIANAAELETIYMTGLTTIQAHLDSGRALKQQVKACTTITQVRAISDDR